MERIIDKSIIFLCCLLAFFLVSYSIDALVALLLVIVVSALKEVVFLPDLLRRALVFVYLLVSFFVPPCMLFIPLVAYDCFQERHWILRGCWALPLLVMLTVYPSNIVILVGIVAGIACVFCWRTERTGLERSEYLTRRDELRETSLALEGRNLALLEKQDYEVNVAILSERARIAREIHDNVGHLLTRSVLQIEALQVVHAADEQIRSELEQVGSTIHQAFDTVRESVHDLHDESFNLRTQLFSMTEQSAAIEIDLNYQGDDVPQALGYCFLAITREALANAAKHSDASRVKISILEYPAFWQLIIHDNGSKNPLIQTDEHLGAYEGDKQGVEWGLKGRGAKGIGLKAMEERTRSLKGVFRVDYERGFRIFVSVPK